MLSKFTIGMAVGVFIIIAILCYGYMYPTAASRMNNVLDRLILPSWRYMWPPMLKTMFKFRRAVVPDPVMDMGMGMDIAQAVFDIHLLQPMHHPYLIRTTKDVHDHEIQQSLRKSIEGLKGWYKTVDTPRSKSVTLEQIKEYIFNGYDGAYTNKENAYSTVRSIEKINGTLTSVEMCELDILCMVWERIMDNINKDHVDELKSNLLELLADATIRLDNSYCLVGRVTRMVQSLDSLDQEGIVNIVSTDIIEGEIKNKIPVLINSYFKEHQEEKELYDTGDDDIAIKLRAYVESNLLKDYQDTTVSTKYSETINRYLEALA